MMVKTILNSACLYMVLATVSNAIAQEPPKPQAVNKVLEGYTQEESRDFIRNFNVADLTSGGPGALWFNNHASQVTRTALLPRRQPVMELPVALDPGIGAVRVTTELGKLSLDEYLAHPKSYAQGFVVIHNGQMVYQQYPGMREADLHFWASNAKVLASLAVDLLIEDGLIDQNQSIDSYVPEFKGTVWGPVSVIDILDMTTGLDVSDSPETFRNPQAVTVRMFKAELGEPKDGRIERLIDVMKDAEKVQEPGREYVYSSAATQALVFLVEAVAGQSWSDFFEQRVWSKMGVEGPLQVHLSPDGIALVHGPISSNLRDMARIGMLYTPSWNKVAVESIVTPPILNRIQGTQRSQQFYRAGASGPRFIKRLGDDTVKTAARQWDAIWDDGDFFKSGLNTQGLYVSPGRDLVIAFFSTEPSHRIQQYLRPLVTSGLFDD